MVRSIARWLVDLVDGLLAGVLYGGEGGLLYTSTDLEAQNKAKMRGWAAGPRRAAGDEDERDNRPKNRDDFDARMRKFRRHAGEEPYE